MGVVVGQFASRPVVEEADEVPGRESDEALVLAAQVDRAAFAALYTRYVDLVYRFCYRRLGNRAAAEDATSKIFERALAALPRYKAGSFRSWLFTIARNTVLDTYRADKGDQPLAAADSMHDQRPGPEELSLDAADSRWIRDLLAQLNPLQRQIVELRLAGLTDVEIARVLGRTRGSVRTAQHRALQRLRALIAAESRRNEDRHAS